MTDASNQTGLQFFGSVSASISHELKNRFAIVNEQAGLLADLVLMAEKGRELDPERLKRLADSLKKQVALADDLLRHMNRFSHSVDHLEGETDIVEAVACIVALTRRNADRRNVRLDVRPPAETPPMLHGPAFAAMHLIRTILEGAMGPGVESRTLTVSCEPSPEGAAVRIRGVADAGALQRIVAGADGPIGHLGVRVMPETDSAEVRIVFPRSFGGPERPEAT